MASVFQRDGGSTWYVKWTDAAGTVQQKATTAATRAEAKRLALELERKVERQRLGLEALPVDSGWTLGDLVEWWLKERCPPASEPGERLRLGKHVARQPIGRLPLGAVTGEIVEERLKAMERDGAGPGGVNKLRQTLSACFNAARRAKRYLGANPILDTERRRQVKRVWPTLTPDEVGPVLRAVPLAWRGECATAIYLALRKGEILGLRASDVDLRRRRLVVARSYDRETTKGGHADTLPIPADLVPYLERALARSKEAGGLMFPGRDGKMRSKEADPQKVLRRALGRAGVVEGYNLVCRRCKARGAKHTRKVERLPDPLGDCPACGFALWPVPLPRPMRFHDLRHTTATLLLARGVPLQHVQRIMRHADIQTTVNVYGHLGIEDLRGAVEQVAPGAASGPAPEPLHPSRRAKGKP